MYCSLYICEHTQKVYLYYRCQSEPAIHAMQFLDVITMKDPNQKSNFYRGTLIDALPYIPKVSTFFNARLIYNLNDLVLFYITTVAASSYYFKHNRLNGFFIGLF